MTKHKKQKDLTVADLQNGDLADPLTQALIKRLTTVIAYFSPDDSAYYQDNLAEVLANANEIRGKNKERHDVAREPRKAKRKIELDLLTKLNKEDATFYRSELRQCKINLAHWQQELASLEDANA